jgi:hypothetical protein
MPELMERRYIVMVLVAAIGFIVIGNTVGDGFARLGLWLAIGVILALLLDLIALPWASRRGETSIRK